MNKIINKKKGIYIHIPFCKYICTYCDFNKYFIQNQPVDKYIQCLIKEINLNINNCEDIETIYIGGGTPSALTDEQLILLLETLDKKIDIKKIKEYTIEANPEDLTIEKIKILKKYNINRVSMGVQTLNDELLKIIGRGHTKKDVELAIKNLLKIGITNINVDIMFALPKQSYKDLYETIQLITSYDITHISCYSLILEKRTKLFNQVKSKQIILPTNEIEEKMYEIVIKKLKEQNFYQYEISNFSKSGYESVHNSNYWRNYEYYGFGAGAHGYLDRKRYSNYGPLKFYIENIEKYNDAKREEKEITKKEKIEEHFFLGLRLLEGIDLSNVDRLYNIASKEIYKKSIEKNIKKGYLVLNNNKLQLTYKGLFFGNEVFSDFLL